MKRFFVLLIFISPYVLCASNQKAEEWITVLIHGAVGFKVHASPTTILQARRDCIDGTPYETSVLRVREEPYLTTIQPIQKRGLVPVVEYPDCVNASFVFGTILDELQAMLGIKEKNYYYTFGWSGLISDKRRYDDARIFYKELKELLAQLKKQKKQPKIRLIGYSHGGQMLLNLGDIRNDEHCKDTFVINETYLVGMPVTTVTANQIESPIFKKIYNIYSKGDKVQRIDIFSPCDLLSHRLFKGEFTADLTQIEYRITARLSNPTGKNLPVNMRGVIDQSPGHVELWSFGWAESSYRKNISIYPLSAAVFVPYLARAAAELGCPHVKIDIRPEQEKAIVRSLGCSYSPPYRDTKCIEVPFITRKQYEELKKKAAEFHPMCPKYKERFCAWRKAADVEAYI